MNIPPLLTFDPALLDMDNMSVEKWYALLYNRTVQQQDTFVGDFKKKVVELIKTCTNKPNTTTESLKQDITNTINESQFEFEHQKFIDGIVGNAYEYLCQFIIKNSIDNIRRTQCALNCFSLSNSLNYGTIKPCYNENILLQDSSKLPQIQCSSEPSDNTNDTAKTVQPYFNDSENDPNSMLMAVRENIKNDMENKIETTSFHSYEETLEINNLSIESPNDESFNNIHTNNDENTSLTIDDDDKTTQAIISLAMKIQQANFHDVDYFEANELNNSNICTNNEDLTAKCLLEQNGDQILDPLKLEEEYKINNSLKLLESLVNIEHDKLEVQKSLVNNEPQSNIENSEKNLFKSPTKVKIGKKKSRKLQENIHKEDEEEWLPSNEKQKNHYSKKTKTNKKKSDENRATKKNKKMETQNTLNNLFASSSSSFVEIKNDQSTSVTMNEFLFPSYTKKPETVVSTVKNTKSLDTSCRTGTLLAYQNEKGCLPTSEFKQLSDDVESIPHIEKKKRLTTVNNSDVLSNKTSPIASTSGYNEKDFDSLKSKLSSPSGSSMKTLDYKKIYEKDRKSLFNPDVIIIKNVPSKSSKELINDPQMKKEYNSIQKKEDSEKKPKPKICEVENNKTSNKRKKLTKQNVDKVEITDNSSKLKNDSKSKTNCASTSKNKYKRIKVTKSDDTANTNAVSNKNNKSNTKDVLENKVSRKIETLDSQDLNRTNILKSNMLDEGTSEHQQLNGTNLLENKESDENTLVNETMPEWIRLLWATHNIKPCYVVIDPNVTY